MPDCIPTKSPATEVTVQATAAIIGKRFVKVTAPRVGGGLTGGSSVTTANIAGYDTSTLSGDLVDTYQAGPCSVSGEAALGVAAADIPVGAVGSVFKAGIGHVLPITAGAAITAGQEVQTNAAGQAIPFVAGNKALGYAVDSAASGADAEIALY